MEVLKQPLIPGFQTKLGQREKIARILRQRLAHIQRKAALSVASEWNILAATELDNFNDAFQLFNIFSGLNCLNIMELLVDVGLFGVPRTPEGICLRNGRKMCCLAIMLC